MCPQVINFTEPCWWGETHFTVDILYRSKSEIQAAELGECQALTDQNQGRIPFHPQTSAVLGLWCLDRASSELCNPSKRHSRRKWGEPCDLLLSPSPRSRDELGFWLFGPPALAQWMSFSSRTCSFSSSAASWNSTPRLTNFRLTLGPLPTPWTSLDLPPDTSVTEFSACKMGGRIFFLFHFPGLFYTTPSTEWTLCSWESFKQLGYIFVLKLLLLFKWLFRQTQFCLNPKFCFDLHSVLNPSLMPGHIKQKQLWIWISWKVTGWTLPGKTTFHCYQCWFSSPTAGFLWVWVFNS